MSEEQPKDELYDKIVAAIKTVFDPEIPVNIYEMGLIYGIDINEAREVAIRMTLTAPSCPSAQEIPVNVRNAVQMVRGVTSVTVDIVWEPTWTPNMMSEAARLQTGIM